MVASILSFLQNLHFVDVGVGILLVIKGVEKIFPNASFLKKADSSLSSVLPPQS